MHNEITLPYKYKPRQYQKGILKAFFKEKKKRFLCVWHRRAGKDKTCINIIIASAFERIGTYYYLFPELKQARRDIWEGIGGDGTKFLDHFPSELIRSINKTEMTIEFSNGSIFKLCGADRYDALMGSNPIGIIFSEYSLMNPRAWDYLRPILVENRGWALFQYTPRGMNHGYKLYESIKNNKEWFTELLTVNDTRLDNGEYVISPENIESERIAGMSEEMIQQEFYCSFTSAVQGAYFSEQLRRAQQQDRIRNFPIDTALAVYTYWDIGTSDSTAIWFVQFKREYITCIHYYEFNNQPLQHYVKHLNDYQSQHGIAYGHHYAPHDVMKREFVTAKTTIQLARELGITFRVVPRIGHKIDAINALRSLLGRVTFHMDACQQGLAALREYHAAYNEKHQVFGEPVHNWASHGCDALMQLAQQYQEGKFIHTQNGRAILGRVNHGPL